MVVSFAGFGNSDVKLYREYLFAARVQARCFDNARRLHSIAGNGGRGIDAKVSNCSQGDSAVVVFEGVRKDTDGDDCSDVICDTVNSVVSRDRHSSFGVEFTNRHLGREEDGSNDCREPVVDDTELVGACNSVIGLADCEVFFTQGFDKFERTIDRFESAVERLIVDQRQFVSRGLEGDSKDDSKVTSKQVPSFDDGKDAKSNGFNLGADNDSGVSEKTLINRRLRAKKKERKLRKKNTQSDVPEWRRKTNGGGYHGAFGSCSVETRVKLAETRAQRLIAENEACVRKAKAESDGWEQSQKAKRKRDSLRALQVDQRIELTRSRDLEKIKKRDEVRVMRDTETSKVAVEKAFESLAVTGNIPSFVGGTVETIVGSASISPSSSISDAEVRKLRKDFSDLEAEQIKVRKSNDTLVARLRAIESYAKNDDLVGIKKVTKEECQEMYEESVGITVDSNGIPMCEFDEGFGGYIDDKGRFHFGEDINAFVASY